MGESQRLLEEELQYFCKQYYDDDWNKMILDLLVILGRQSEYIIDE